MPDELILKAKKGPKCLLCKLVSESPDIANLVNKEKFDKEISADQLSKMLTERLGRTITRLQVANHYKKHCPIDITNKYHEQAAQFCNLTENTRNIGTGRSHEMRFDALEALKKMYLELSERVTTFEGHYGKNMTPDNMKTYASISEELRKLASDIAKTETDREYISHKILDVFRDVVSDLISRDGDAMREGLLKFVSSDSDKKRVIEFVKDLMNRNIEFALKKLENDISKKL